MDAGTSGNSESHPTLTRPEWSALRPVGVYFNWTQSMPVAAYSHHAGLSVQKTPYSAGSPITLISVFIFDWNTNWNALKKRGSPLLKNLDQG